MLRGLVSERLFVAKPAPIGKGPVLYRQRSDMTPPKSLKSHERGDENDWGFGEKAEEEEDNEFV